MAGEETVYVGLGKDVAPKILQIIEEARREVVLVSPFVDPGFVDMSSKVIRDASKRNVEVTFVFGVGRQVRSYWSEEDHFAAMVKLRDLGVHRIPVPKLHAKIYLNENKILLSSMNFTAASKTSLEICNYITDEESQKQIRVGVKRLLGRPSLRTYCARCGKPNRPKNHEKAQDLPLCPRCYDEWKQTNGL